MGPWALLTLLLLTDASALELVLGNTHSNHAKETWERLEVGLRAVKSTSEFGVYTAAISDLRKNLARDSSAFDSMEIPGRPGTYGNIRDVIADKIREIYPQLPQTQKDELDKVTNDYLETMGRSIRGRPLAEAEKSAYENVGGKNTWQIFHRLGYHFMESGELDTAVLYFKRALRFMPREVRGDPFSEKILAEIHKWMGICREKAAFSGIQQIVDEASHTLSRLGNFPACDTSDEWNPGFRVRFGEICRTSSRPYWCFKKPEIDFLFEPLEVGRRIYVLGKDIRSNGGFRLFVLNRRTGEPEFPEGTLVGSGVDWLPPPPASRLRHEDGKIILASPLGVFEFGMRGEFLSARQETVNELVMLKEDKMARAVELMDQIQNHEELNNVTTTPGRAGIIIKDILSSQGEAGIIAGISLLTKRYRFERRAIFEALSEITPPSEALLQMYEKLFDGRLFAADDRDMLIWSLKPFGQRAAGLIAKAVRNPADAKAYSSALLLISTEGISSPEILAALIAPKSDLEQDLEAIRTLATLRSLPRNVIERLKENILSDRYAEKEEYKVFVDTLERDASAGEVEELAKTLVERINPRLSLETKWAMWKLQRIGSHARAQIPEVIKIAQTHNNPNVRSSAQQALVKMAGSSVEDRQSVAIALLPGLRDTEATVVQSAVTALMGLGSDTVSILPDLFTLAREGPRCEWESGTYQTRIMDIVQMMGPRAIPVIEAEIQRAKAAKNFALTQDLRVTLQIMKARRQERFR